MIYCDMADSVLLVAAGRELELMDGLELHQLMVYPIIQYLNFVDMDDGDKPPIFINVENIC